MALNRGVSRTVWAWSNLDSCLNFTGRDLHLKSAKFGLVKFSVMRIFRLRHICNYKQN
ncbi:hypothetical protein CAMSH0001_1825 [Campylobacter showae RM3277]|uniref:Uncharacterized protein n=1 Tax=Campylobacter showae RM3277 TaxID=553219 RepID=C6RDA9_9BACT|nr:hypothetical protein CAMSH0001_1825 [Campylobacter showae RM3277]